MSQFVSNPPAAPLLIYDGDCGFCRRWVTRWQAATGSTVDYAPSQEVGSRWPEIGPQAFAAATYLIEPDGRATKGAEAAFRALAFSGRSRWLFWSYQHLPGFAEASETVYRFVALHRGGLAKFDRWLFGDEPQWPSYLIARGVFVRALGLIYLIAFLSLWVQIDGLIGSRGIVPVKEFLGRYQSAGAIRFPALPTLCWLSSDDSLLHVLCGGGVLLSLLLVLGLFPAAVAFLLWLFYLSLTVAGQEFLGFQWDALLLEAGFLAIFISPLQWRLSLARPSKPPALMIWMVRWLAFRVMFLSGALKWTAGDVIWQGLAAMRYHYETQPIPTWTAWYAHWMPDSFQVFSALMVFIIEALVPLLFFLPRRLRIIGFWITVIFQCIIMATGNYGFFNLLTIVLCVTLLDDQSWPRRCWLRVRDAVGTRQALHRRWPAFITTALAVVLFMISFTYVDEALWPGARWKPWLAEARAWASTFRLANGYGLFRVMTTERPEIVIEGSDDGIHWLPYEFKWKPGDPMRPPSFCIPHMPRLDWQMWFAALSPPSQAQCLASFAQRLLEGSPPVLGLLERNPFPTHPPRYVRAMMYDYHFSDPATRHTSRAWWMRQRLGVLFTMQRRPP